MTKCGAEIIKAWLKDNGYDGLCNPDLECGCTVEDFRPCVDDPSDCQPAYSVPAEPGAGVDSWMVTTKPTEEPTDG